MSKLLVPSGAALLLILAGSVWQGRIMDRPFPLFGAPKPNEMLEQFAERLPQVPYEFGDWVGEDTPQTEEDELQLKYARVVGSLSRVYTHRYTGEQISLLIVCGKSQHVADHTPDQCFRAAGFAMLGDPVRYRHTVRSEDADDEDDVEPISVEFASAVFQKQHEDRPDERARVFWTWRSEGEGWRAPKWPLLHYAGTPALYKLYLMRPLGTVLVDISKDPALEFTDAAMPVIDRILMPPKGQSGAGAAATATPPTATEPESPSESAQPTAGEDS